ncbi:MULTISPECIES: hypothetical protein [Bacillaceae]|nr:MULTISPECIES: hypothetical protein [Bacillaceae]MCT4475706.1 hypothetical protein [Peribacillus frigoritolerans]PKF86976.1 hypothetical protein CW306_19480 [Bacillus sp. BA3]CAH0276560.1 hypothetical protein SRABI134_03891 [Peribacillus sp. Bi134]
MMLSVRNLGYVSNISIYDKPKKVAILDSVINDQQPALNGQIVAKYDVIKQQMFIIFTLTRMQRKL